MLAATAARQWMFSSIDVNGFTVEYFVFLLLPLQVIDHLCMVDKLGEGGYDPHLVEDALHLFENDIQKVRHKILSLNLARLL